MISAVPKALFKETVDIIKSDIKREKTQPLSTMSMDITLEGINPYFIPEFAAENNIKYFESLLLWINDNCNIIIPERLLDFLRISDEQSTNGVQNKYFVNNLLLIIDHPNRILITEDTYNILTPQLGPFYSTEAYLKWLLGTNHPALDEFVRKDMSVLR